MYNIQVGIRLLVINSTNTGFTAEGATVVGNDGYIVHFTYDSGIQSNCYLDSIYREDGVYVVERRNCDTEYARWQRAMVTVRCFWDYQRLKCGHFSDQDGWQALYAMVERGKLIIGEIPSEDVMIEGFKAIGITLQ